MRKYDEIIKIVGFLKEDFPKLTDFEALQIAVRMSQNEIIADGLCVNNQNLPVALEAIAMALGHS